MTADPRLVAIRRRAHAAWNTADREAYLRAVRLVVTPDGRVDLSRGINAIPDDAAPDIALDQAAATEASGYQTAYDQLAAAFTTANTVDVAHGGTGATTASGARTALGLAIGTDVLPVNNPTATGLVTVGQRLKSAGGAPTIAVGAAAGTGASASIVEGTDLFGVLAVTTGTGPGTGTLATITFNTTRTATFTPFLFPSGNNARLALPNLRIDRANRSTTQWVITASVALTASVLHEFYYLTIGEY